MNNPKSIRVATYNLLHNTENIENRYLAVKKEIATHNPDIIGFQECFNTSWEYLKNLLEPLGYVHTYKIFNYQLKHDRKAEWAGNSIVSKYPLRNVKEITFDEVYPYIPKTKIPSALSAEILLPTGQHFNFLVHHAAWRAENEKYRYWQAEQINRTVEKLSPGLFTVLVGDFNATENGHTMKYFIGETPDRHGDFVYWVDAYKLKGSKEDYVTSSPELYWGKQTAKITNIIHPEELPNRRIDYILVKGWVYGSDGSPLTFGRMGTELTGNQDEPTDHYGIYSDLLLV